jgi:formylglycine-generating enzyme required for sulfatase activity
VLIPEGAFPRGCDVERDPSCNEEERPQRTLHLSAFWIDRTEATIGQYQQCVSAGACAKLDTMTATASPERAVTGVSWFEAQQYCAWKKMRLPTEAEWEKAARGTDGRIFPWGDDQPDCNQADYETCGTPRAPVGSRKEGASPFGMLDAAGGVEEWVVDFFESDYYSRAPERDPQGPQAGKTRVIRGGSYDPWHIRATARNWAEPEKRDQLVGFRCARSALSSNR